MNRFYHFPGAVLFFALLTPLAGHAQDAVPKSVEEARKQFEAADAQLNALYKECHTGSIVQAQDKLQKAQRAWVEERDLTAHAYQNNESSQKSLEDNYYYHAATVLTQSRIKELQTLFQNQ